VLKQQVEELPEIISLIDQNKKKGWMNKFSGGMK
jgi:hypothetical protein